MAVGKLLRNTLAVQLEPIPADTPALESESALTVLEDAVAGMESMQRLLINLDSLSNESNVDDQQIQHVLSQEGLTYEDLQIEITMEAFGDRIRKIIQAILRAFDRFLDMIHAAFEAVFNDINQLAMFVRDTKLRLSSKEGRFPQQPRVELGRQAVFLATDRGRIRGIRDLMGGLGELRSQLNLLRIYYANPVAQLGKKLPGMLERVNLDPGTDPSGNLQLLRQLNDTFAEINFNNIASRLTRLNPFVDYRYPTGATFIGSPLIGMRSLIFVFGDKLHPEDYVSDDPIRRAAAVQSSRIHLARSNPQRRAPGGDTAVEAMLYPTLSEYIRTVELVIDEASNAYKTSLKAQLRSGSKEMKRSLAKMQAVRSGQTNHLLPFVNYCTTYIEWARSPYLQMLSFSLVVCREALLFARKHINNLK